MTIIITLLGYKRNIRNIRNNRNNRNY